MTHLQLEELVSYFFYRQPQNGKQFTQLDFLRLVEEIGLETANEFRIVIAREIAEGHSPHVIQALLAA